VAKDISSRTIRTLREVFSPLVGIKIDWLAIPEKALAGFEPSQIAVIANTVLDAALPQLDLVSGNRSSTALQQIGLKKAPGIIGQRESYPDYIHLSGSRVELKGLYVDNPNLSMKRPPTKREPSARLKENIRQDNVDPAHDVLLIVAVRLEEMNGRYSPTIVDVEIFSMIDCIRSRDSRHASAGGMWIGKLPVVIKRTSAFKRREKIQLERDDFEKDTNFGKLKRIPYPPLQEFMRKHGAI
jgi:hypothetical protein